MLSTSCASRVERVSPFRCRSCNGQRNVACKASSSVSSFGENARRFVRQKSREFGKVVIDASEQVNTKAEEAFKEADRKYSINRRVKNAVTDFRRRLPYWKRQLDDFGSRPLGKLVLWTAFCLSITSGLLFRALNIAFMLWWLVTLLMIPFLGAIRKQQARRMQEEAARMQEAQQRARNPFSDFGFGGFRAPRQPGAGAQSRGEGPILDAEWTTIDESDGRQRR